MQQVDLFEMAIYDTYSTSVFVGKVNLGNDQNHFTFKMPVVYKQYGTDRICDVKLQKSYQHQLFDAIFSTYYQYPKYRVYEPLVGDMIFSSQYQYLWEFNFAVILRLKELLNIATPITFAAEPPHIGKTEDLIWMCDNYAADVYVSGISGKHYIDDSMFNNRGIELRYFEGGGSKYSILTDIFMGDFLQ